MAAALKRAQAFLRIAISVFIHQLLRSLTHYLGRAVVSENKPRRLRTADICISLFLHRHSNRLLPWIPTSPLRERWSPEIQTECSSSLSSINLVWILIKSCIISEWIQHEHTNRVWSVSVYLWIICVFNISRERWTWAISPLWPEASRSGHDGARYWRRQTCLQTRSSTVVITAKCWFHLRLWKCVLLLLILCFVVIASPPPTITAPELNWGT